MKVSVAICTWNRAKLLEQTLAQLQHLRIPDGVEWELIVVDNNSTDTTRDVLPKFTSILPLRALFEPKQGHSNARNCAMKAATGDLLIWTDDDVLVEENWLAAYVAAVQRWPDAGYFGGRVVPWLVEQPPEFLQNHPGLFNQIVVACDFGPTERWLQPSEFPYGANVAFRMAALLGKQFNPELGRKGLGMLGSDETTLIKQLNSEGRQGVWVPDSVVQHYVEPQRLTLDFAWRFYEGEGRTLTRLNGPDEGTLFRGSPRWLYREFGALWLKSYMQRVLRKPEWFVTYMEAAKWWGRILENRVLGAYQDRT